MIVDKIQYDHAFFLQLWAAGTGSPARELHSGRSGFFTADDAAEKGPPVRRQTSKSADSSSWDWPRDSARAGVGVWKAAGQTGLVCGNDGINTSR